MYKFLIALSVALSVLGTSFADAPAAGGFDIMSFLPIVLMIAIFYFLIIRPQQKKTAQHAELVNNLKRGDRVMTAGGIIATVDRIISDQEISLEIAEGVKIRFARQMVTDITSKGVPVVDKKIEAPSKDLVNKDLPKKDLPKKDLAKKSPSKKPTKPIIKK